EAKVREVFSELEFRSLLKTVLGEEAQLEAVSPRPASRKKVTPKHQMDMFGGGAGGEEPHAPAADVHQMDDLSTVPHDYRIATTAEEQEALARKLAGLGTFAFDTETDSLVLRKAELVGLSFSWK